MRVQRGVTFVIGQKRGRNIYRFKILECLVLSPSYKCWMQGSAIPHNTFAPTLGKPPLSTSFSFQGLLHILHASPILCRSSAPPSAISCLHPYHVVLSLYRKPNARLLLDGLSKLIPNPWVL